MIQSSAARIRQLFFYIFALSLFFSSCKKSGDQFVGRDLVPSGDNFLFTTTDTFDVLMYSVLRDSTAATGHRAQSVNQMGFMNDPYLGKCTSSMYAQIRLPENNLDFSAVHIDSVVLTLKYSGVNTYFGNISSPQRINVYELTQSMFIDSPYYSYSKLDYDPNPIAQADVVYNTKDSFTVVQGTRSKRLPPHLRIRISPFSSFVTKLKFGGTNYASNEAFVSYMKGLAIVPQDNGLAPGEGSIVNFDLVSGVSNLTIYYNDSLSKDLLINGNSPRFNNVRYDYTGTMFEKQAANKKHRDTTCIQSLGGARTFVRFPTVTNLLKNNDNHGIAVIQAKLTIPILPGSYSSGFNLPGHSLVAFKADSAGNCFDRYSVYHAVHQFNSDKTAITIDLSKYFLQEMLTNYQKYGYSMNYGLFLASYYPGLERIVLSTNKTVALRPKLVLTYTVVK